jgi:hypothetical protein
MCPFIRLVNEYQSQPMTKLTKGIYSGYLPATRGDSLVCLICFVAGVLPLEFAREQPSKACSFGWPKRVLIPLSSAEIKLLGCCHGCLRPSRHFHPGRTGKPRTIFRSVCHIMPLRDAAQCTRPNFTNPSCWKERDWNPIGQSLRD